MALKPKAKKKAAAKKSKAPAIDFSEDVGKAPVSLEEVSELCKQYVNAEAAVALAEQGVKDAKAIFLTLKMETIPDLFMENNIETFKMQSGETINVKADCNASIVKEQHGAALTWLIDNDFGGLIKTVVSVAFGVGDEETASEVSESLAEDYEAVTMNKTVHPSTLRSFAKEQLEEGQTLPSEYFTITPFNVAKITR